MNQQGSFPYCHDPTFGYRETTTGFTMKPITNQEKKILELIGDGYSTGQIAFALDISAHTVESHRKSLLAKFGAKNSPELIRKAIQHKDLTPHTRNQNITPNTYPNEDKS